jgi:peptide/nickel transport system ATP-binding protein
MTPATAPAATRLAEADGGALLEVTDLTVSLVADETPIIDGIDLDVAAGEVVGLVGESGSGKSTLGLALLGYARPGGKITAGRVVVDGIDMIRGGERAARDRRGRLVSYVPQDPAVALNPSLRVAQQLREVLRLDVDRSTRGIVEGIGAALRQANLPHDAEFLSRYPHQLSGGQQQRLSIAVALARGPKVVVLDEPTTGLDVVTQARILGEVRRLRDETGVSFVYVSHDLSAISEVADRVLVMYGGHVVEEAPTAVLVTRPRHPYTRGLVASVPDHATPLHLVGIPGTAPGLRERTRAGCRFVARCPQRVDRCSREDPPLEPVPMATPVDIPMTTPVDSARHSPEDSSSHPPGRGDRQELVRCFEWRRTPSVEVLTRRVGSVTLGRPLLRVDSLRAEHVGRHVTVVAADDVSFDLVSGECLALVGQSGSGKSTIARCLAGLHRPTRGEIVLDGERLAAAAGRRTREQRRRLQIVFQNPYDSLNPRHDVRSTITWSARRLRGLGRRQAEREVADLLDLVRLPTGLASRFPAELSGGERQRVVIARALAARPDVLLCDEVTSALDVSVQAAVLDLLLSLRRDLGMTMLFITHDLGVVASIADRVAVLEHGRIRESGPVSDVLSRPTDTYTRDLVAAAPRLEGRPTVAEPSLGGRA